MGGRHGATHGVYRTKLNSIIFLINKQNTICKYWDAYELFSPCE